MPRKKILIIDDDPDCIEIIKVALLGEGYEIISASNGKKGVVLAKAEKPDIILLDLMMPVEDGFTACKELKHDPELSNIPVLIITSIGGMLTESVYDLAREFNLESDDYIDKPIHKEALRLKLRKVLA